MPVIINSEEIHPFLPSLGSPLAIERLRAERQDIRPLDIAIINLMADKIATERQLALWLGNTMLQVNLNFVATDSYMQGVQAGRETKNTPAEHIRKFYSGFGDIKHKKFDGVIVTGVNGLKPRVEQEEIWAEVAEILQWSTTNAFSSLFLCWGAKAALKYFHNIDSHKADQKLFGVFDHRLVSDKTGILFGFPDIFRFPYRAGKAQNAKTFKNARHWKSSPTQRNPARISSLSQHPMKMANFFIPNVSISSIIPNMIRKRWVSNIAVTVRIIPPIRNRRTISRTAIRRAPRLICGGIRLSSILTG